MIMNIFMVGMGSMFKQAALMKLEQARSLELGKDITAEEADKLFSQYSRREATSEGFFHQNQ
ncbi:hypothetical protein [Xenorhabdus sp. IM139775]|uniref:hypothetical protein n=1 Tax=Xenorhabdus sp. IM139775 TaxID=3025876 RepID=UPI002358133A|nr:hypothetical protein [Xenorhabdus sp. IM139775]MDC9594698.1 hypothetical protein [Xenorhabdus sp. IM139775]